MRTVFIGIGIYVLGFILVGFCSSVFNGGRTEFSYYSAIAFSILYLCAIIAASTSMILRELKNKSNN